jgi:hypothetical protein
MVINLLWYVACVAVIAALAANVAFPLIFPRYKMFWMFRKDHVWEAEEELEEALKGKEFRNLKRKVKEIDNDEE